MSNLSRVAVIDGRPMSREGIVSVLARADGIEGGRNRSGRAQGGAGIRAGRHAP